MDTRTETKAARLVDQAVRLYGMTRRQARQWAFGELVRDFETEARNAALVRTSWSATLGCAVTVPEE